MKIKMSLKMSKILIFSRIMHDALGTLSISYRVLFCLLIGISPINYAASTQASPNWGQLASTLFQHITTEKGLPVPFVMALAEDNEGFLWVGTQSGLARWDGYRFRLYVPDAKDKGSLPSLLVHKLHTDWRGQLWVGMGNGALARYDSNQDRFIRIPGGPDGINHSIIHAIADDSDKGIWVGGSDGLDHVVTHNAPGAKGSKVTHFRHDTKNPASLPAGSVNALLSDQKGNLWVGTQNGLAVLRPKTKHFITVQLPMAAHTLPHILSIAQSSEGDIWVGTDSQGVLIIDSATLAVSTLLETNAAAADNLQTETIQFIKQVTPNQMWISCFGNGILVVNTATMQTHRLRHDSATQTSIADNTSQAILRDRSGLIWIGGQHGLSRHDPAQTAILSLFGGGTRQGSITDVNVTSVMPMPNGSIWIGLQNKGVNIIDAATNHRAWRSAQSQIKIGIVNTLSAPHNDTVYLGSSRGLFRTNLSSNRIQHLHFPGRNPESQIQSLLLDGKLLWVGSIDGLWRIDLNKVGYEKFSRIPGTDQLNKIAINVLVRDTDGALWIGTQNKGLYRFDPVSHQLQSFQSAPNAPNALSSNGITSLLFDAIGRLWIGTKGGGINLLTNPKAKDQPHFKKLTTADGLPHNSINKLLADHKDDIWASTDAGLAIVNGTTFAVQALQQAEGIAISAYWSNSGGKTAQGDLLFGGIDGLTVVRPELFKRWNYSPPVMVTQIQLGEKEQVGSHYNDMPLIHSFSPDPSLSNMLLIQPEDNSIGVEFSALDYSAPERNRYAYRLDGYNKDWINTDSSRRFASYTNLPPGDYRLRMRGSNRDGVFNLQERVIPIRVLPAWYQTVWFMALALFLVSSTIYGIYRLRTRFLKKLIAARTADILKLGKIGQELTSTLDAEQAFERVSKQVSARLDAAVFMIGIYNEKTAQIVFVYEIENAQRQPVSFQNMSERERPAVWCIRERRELVVSNTAELLNYISTTLPPSSGEKMETVVYLPLMIEQRVIGCLSVQSLKKNAYDENQLEFLRVLASYTAITLSNSIAHEDLATAHKQMQETQQQMLLQEKMAGLGTLTAGVAHEINNPTNFVHVAAQIQRTDIAEFQTFVTGLIEEEDTEEIRLAFNQRFKKLEENVTLMLNGTERIKGIVRDLRAFTRQEESEKRLAKLSECLTSTLNLVRTSWMEKVEFITDFTDDPEIECWPAQLNQVFMNLMINGCQAIAEKQQTDQTQNPVAGKLSIRLKLNHQTTPPETVSIIFEDNGVGMDEKIQARVMEPFFTTKEVGSGTGLGLSIAFGIIQRHSGNLTFTSTPGVGSQFTVHLPIEKPPSRKYDL